MAAHIICRCLVHLVLNVFRSLPELPGVVELRIFPFLIGKVVALTQMAVIPWGVPSSCRLKIQLTPVRLRAASARHLGRLTLAPRGPVRFDSVTIKG